MKIFDELEGRGLVKQTTNTEKIRQLLNEDKITFYIGFDPTADSLHVGHLLQLVTAKRLADAGHKAIMLIGTATAQIGDPTGKNTMRPELREHNAILNGLAIEEQITKLVPNCVPLRNGIWFAHSLSFMEFIQEIGPHFSVNNMLRADCFKSRLENGLSFLEFNYMLMQAFDFLKLTDFMGANCQLQIGGDDQWSNILAGIDLIHKKKRKEVFGLTLPLLVNSDGTKMGKTEKGTVWLDAKKTSPFDFFQFWRNIPDDKVEQCLMFLTDMKPEEFIESSFDVNHQKKHLAFELTKLVHGEDVATETLKQVESLFESRDSSVIEATSIEDGIQLLDLLVRGGFAKSRTDARNLINGRGIAINDQVITDPLTVISQSSLGPNFTVRKGKKSFGRFVFKDSNEKTRFCDQRGS